MKSSDAKNVYDNPALNKSSYGAPERVQEASISWVKWNNEPTET
jgi:hypothetical protein